MKGRQMQDLRFVPPTEANERSICGCHGVYLHKAGFTRDGDQRWRCAVSNRIYRPDLRAFNARRWNQQNPTRYAINYANYLARKAAK